MASPAVRSGRTLAGSRDISLGPSELVDGFTNGWPVSTADLRALRAGPSGSFTVSLTWTPQRQVWEALIISLVTLLVCLALALLPLRRRLRRRAPAPALAGESSRETAR